VSYLPFMLATACHLPQLQARTVATECQPASGQSYPTMALPNVTPPLRCCRPALPAGKSTLLVALLHFLLQQRGKQGSPLRDSRILVAAHTNVAVDRVLLGEAGGWVGRRSSSRTRGGAGGSVGCEWGKAGSRLGQVGKEGVQARGITGESGAAGSCIPTANVL